MGYPLVSIIVPAYNVECYLDRCLRSLIEQVYPNIEILLINDGSTDSTPEICKDWQKRDSRIRYFSKDNGGLSDARNFGIVRSKGPLLMFVDSDDVIDPKCVALLYKGLVEGDADISFSANLQRFTSDNELIFYDNSIQSLTVYTQNDFAEEFFRLKGNRTLHYACSKLYKKKVLDSDHFPKGMLNEDVEGTFKAMIRADRIVEIDSSVYWYFVNPASITQSAFGENYLNLSEVWRRVVDIAKTSAPQYLSAAEYNCYRADFTILCEMILKGDRVTDEKYADEAHELIHRLRNHLGTLLRGGMILNRKLLAIVIAYFFTPLRGVYRKMNFLSKGNV